MMPLGITGDATTYKLQKERSKYKTGLHCRLRGPRTQIPNRWKLEHTAKPAGLWMQPRAARIETNRGDEAKPSPSKTTATNKKREGRGRSTHPIRPELNKNVTAGSIGLHSPKT
jgi:hypothetical protein